MAYWQEAKKITVPGNGTATFGFVHHAPLDRLTIWAVSGARTIANLSFQPQINGQNYADAVPMTGSIISALIFGSGGALKDNNLFPFRPPPYAASLDPFDLSVLITNGDADPADVTLYAIGLVQL